MYHNINEFQNRSHKVKEVAIGSYVTANKRLLAVTVTANKRLLAVTITVKKTLLWVEKSCILIAFWNDYRTLFVLLYGHI